MSEFARETNATPYDDGALYDLFFERFDYGLEFYLTLARAARSPVLDIACGTGRMLLPMLEAGIDADGLDLFPAMLETLRKKASARGFTPSLYRSDMSEFRLPRRYALIVIPFNAFIHNLTADAQLSALRCCKDHLQPSGVLAFDTFFPGAALITSPEHARALEMETKNPQTGLPVRLFDTRSFDRVKQLQHSRIEIEMLDAAGNVTATHASQTTTRWIYKSEMELLLRLAGFERFEIFGGFDGQPLVQDTDAMIVQAWKSTTD
jgi:SAM-dependent methyltransferase